MENLTVEDIVRESNGKLILGDKKFICRKFSKDTRIIEEGDIYIAIKGEKFYELYCSVPKIPSFHL